MNDSDKKALDKFMPEGWLFTIGMGAAYLAIAAVPIPAAILGTGLLARYVWKNNDWRRRDRPEDIAQALDQHGFRPEDYLP